jgi:lauroyl/myristoyl acyltransferase/mitochondrial fission protein ELM1
MHRVRDIAIYMLVIATGFVVRRLPRSASLWLGVGIGNFVYRSVKRRRKIALANLRMTLGDEREDEELRQIARRSFQNMGKTLVEFLSFPKYNAERLLSLARIEGMGNFQRAMATGKGVIAVSAHFGNWELIFQIIALLTEHTSAIVQPFKHHRLDRLVNRYRTRHGGKVIQKKTAVKQSLSLLRQGQCVAIMGDQNAGNSGVFVDFFGIPASTPRGPVMFALRTGAPILSIFSIRQEDDSHLMIISEPMELKILGDPEKDVEVNTLRLVKQLEKLVRKYPSQWLWMHNRWKTRPSPECQMQDSRYRHPASGIQHPVSSIQHPVSSILVLSDGKPGHYNQSLGIMDRMRDTSVETIEVRFKRKWRDDLLRISTRLLAGVKLHRELIKAMLKWAMEKYSVAAVLRGRHFDVILSTGSSVAAPNLLLGQLMGAKTVVCTRPSPVGISHFDLAILPEHMRSRRSDKNALMTLGVPNRITPEYVRAAGTCLAEKLSVSSRGMGDFPHTARGGDRGSTSVESGGTIGLLLGGDDRHYSIPPDMVSLLCDILLDICEEIDARLALTTSRRTDPKSEDVVKSKMLDNPLCCFLVLAGDPQRESEDSPLTKGDRGLSEPKGNPVPGILGISDVTIVTEDSFSMVCEAASSGRKIVILEVERKKQEPKRQRVYQLLTERGYAKRADMSNLKNVVLDFASDTAAPKVLDDAQTAADALRDLIISR